MSSDCPICVDYNSSEGSVKILRNETKNYKRKTAKNESAAAENKHLKSTSKPEPLSPVTRWAPIVDLMTLSSEDSGNEVEIKDKNRATKRRKCGLWKDACNFLGEHNGK